MSRVLGKALLLVLLVGPAAWFGYGIWLAATMPIFDFGRNKGNLRYARATYDAMLATYEKSVQTGFREVADALEANELYQQNGWTDGLPIVPPTEDAVARFLAVANLKADDLIGTEPVRRRNLTAEKVAIAAVMAGCLPEYMPVVVAIVKAMCEPQYALHGSTASTGGSAATHEGRRRDEVGGRPRPHLRSESAVHRRVLPRDHQLHAGRVVPRVLPAAQ